MKITKKFTKQQLEEISHSASILRTCDQINFDLANNINACKSASDIELKKINELIEARKNENDHIESNLFEINIPDIKEADFKEINISGYKEVLSPIGLVKFFYRDAYFNLIGSIIL